MLTLTLVVLPILFLEQRLSTERAHLAEATKALYLTSENLKATGDDLRVLVESIREADAADRAARAPLLTTGHPISDLVLGIALLCFAGYVYTKIGK
jgi:hypothetical protein